MHSATRPPCTLLAAACVLVLGGCGAAGRSAPAAVAPTGLTAPAVADDDERTWREQAVRVWRDGAAAWRPPPGSEHEALEELLDEAPSTPFRGLDHRTASFLRHPWLRDAVPFSCGGPPYDDELRITAALSAREPGLRLLALTILVRVRAPRTVPEQAAVLDERGGFGDDHEVPWLLEELRAAFSLERVAATLAAAPPADRHAADDAMAWACRAAGVRGHGALLPRLVELSRGEHLLVSLAAGRSLEDVPGYRGDAALASCVLGWRYDAYVRAANALARRDPRLLERTLLEATAPDGCVYMQGVLLGRLGHPDAVPLLCRTLPRMSLIDREMFDLVERLAGGAHVDLVDALPERVRPTQRERAVAVRAAVRQRLGLPAD